MDELLVKLSSYGLPGLVVAILTYLLIQAHKQLRASEQARIDDAKASTALILDIQSKFFQMGDKISDILDRLEKRR